MEELLEVATSGSIDRRDRCSSCARPMLYRVDKYGKPTESFCGNIECFLFLVEYVE